MLTKNTRHMKRVVVLIFSFVLFLWCSSVQDSPDESIESRPGFSESQAKQTFIEHGAYLTVSPAENDLGNAYEYDVVEGQVELTNNTVELISIKSINSSCGCSVVNLEQRTIPPGQTLVLHYTMDTARRNGALTAHFDVLFDIGSKTVDQRVAFRSTVHIITKGKVIAEPAFIKKDDVVFSTQFNEKVVLSSPGKEPLPSILDIQHPEWLEVRYSKEQDHEIILEIGGQIPNMSGKLEEKIVVILDNERYSRLEMPLFFWVKGLISFDNMPIVRIAQESNFPVNIDILANFSAPGKIESFFLDSEDIIEKSVDFEVLDELSIMFKVSLPRIDRKEKSQTVFRSTLIVHASIEDNHHTASLPIILIVPI